MKYIYSSTLLLALFASCQNDNDITYTEAKLQKEIYITTNLDSRSRADITDTDLQNFMLSVDQEGEELDYTNVFVKKDDTDASWKTLESGEENAEEKKMLWYNLNSASNIIAVYKNNDANITIENGITGKISTEQSTETIKQDEILYYANSVTPGESGKLDIRFKHLFSKIGITPNISSIAGATIKNVYIHQVYNTYSFNPSNGELQVITEGQGLVKITPFKEKDSSVYEAILLPQAMNNAFIYIEFEQNGEVHKYAATFPEGFNMESGIKYTINLPVNSSSTFASRAAKKYIKITEEEWDL